MAGHHRRCRRQSARLRRHRLGRRRWQRTAQLTAAGYTCAIPPEGRRRPPHDDVATTRTPTNYQAAQAGGPDKLRAQPTSVQPPPAASGFDIKNATVVWWLGPNTPRPADAPRRGVRRPLG